MLADHDIRVYGNPQQWGTYCNNTVLHSHKDHSHRGLLTQGPPTQGSLTQGSLTQGSLTQGPFTGATHTCTTHTGPTHTCITHTCTTQTRTHPQRGRPYTDIFHLVLLKCAPLTVIASTQTSSAWCVYVLYVWQATYPLGTHIHGRTLQPAGLGLHSLSA